MSGVNLKEDPPFGSLSATRLHEAVIAITHGPSCRGENVPAHVRPRPSNRESRGRPKSPKQPNGAKRRR